MSVQYFDPNSAAAGDSGIFGLPFTTTESKLVLIPVPWEATTSYGGGTSQGPEAILEASKQVDLYDLDLGGFYEAGIAMQKMPTAIKKMNRLAKLAAKPIVKAGGANLKNKKMLAALKKVNTLSHKLNDWVYKESKEVIANGQIPGLVGGDHSTPYGLIKALTEEYPNMGVLHFDAHADLRNAYEGFSDSHASIMFNILYRTKLRKLVQVGIRDFCEEEMAIIKKESSRVQTFFDENLAREKANGVSWTKISENIVSNLPDEVYISFDIDGLDPQLCPHTGTPVPGGLSFQEALIIIKMVVESGRRIVGFDLNEVAPGPKGNEWDANVGARMLFKLCGWTLKSHK